MPNEYSSRTRPGPPAPPGTRPGCARSRPRPPARLRTCHSASSRASSTVRAGWPGVVPVEQDQLAGAVDQHVVGVQVPVAERSSAPPGRGSTSPASPRSRLARAATPSPTRRPAPSAAAASRSQLAAAGTVSNHGSGSPCGGAACACSQAEQVARAAGRIRRGRVDGHAVDPLVEPQPAAAQVAGQPDQEPPVAAGHAAGQPDARRRQARRQRRLAAHRLLVGAPEQLLDRIAFAAQVEAPDLPHRTAADAGDRRVRLRYRSDSQRQICLDSRSAALDHLIEAITCG